MQSRGCDHTKVRGHQATLWHVNYGASSSGIPRALSSGLKV